MARGVPALPVHDSLIVPASQEDLTKELLIASYFQEARVRPGLSVERR